MPVTYCCGFLNVRIIANNYRLRSHMIWPMQAQAALTPFMWFLWSLICCPRSGHLGGCLAGFSGNWFRASHMPTWLYIEEDEELPLWVTSSRQTHEDKQQSRTIRNNISVACCNWQNTLILVILIIVFWKDYYYLLHFIDEWKISLWYIRQPCHGHSTV